MLCLAIIDAISFSTLHDGRINFSAKSCDCLLVNIFINSSTGALFEPKIAQSARQC
jgi:hypothetical protein